MTIFAAYGSMAANRCNGYSTNELLDGGFLTKDLTPTDLLSPADKSVSSASPVLLWSKRRGALEYLLEISTTADFNSLILSKSMSDTTYTLSNQDLEGITQLDAATYYWRISTRYSDQKIASRTSRFQVMDANITYVNVNSVSDEQAGNKTAPFKSVQTGIENAQTRRNADPAKSMNIYVAAGTYSEEIIMRPGISIRGGYEGSGWTRNITGNTTTLTAPTDLVIRVGSGVTATYTATTHIEGFTIIGGGSSINYGIYTVSASPTIAFNTITGGSANTNYGIFASGSSQATISSNTITGASGSPVNAYGVYVSSAASPVISGNTISGGGGTQDSCGIYNTGSSSSPTISGNTIIAGVGGTTNAAIYTTGTNSPLISGNNIRAGAGANSTYGVQISAFSNPTIANNVIFGGVSSGVNVGISAASTNALILNNTIGGGFAGNYSYGISLNSSGTPTIRNNIIFTGGGTNRFCIYELAATSAAAFIQNNNLFDCPTALFRDFDGSGQCSSGGSSSGGNCINIADMEADLNAEITSTASGNVSIGNSSNQLFIDIDGADNNLITQADNDWHITTSAAICEVRSGGRDLSGSFTTDRDGLIRTISAIAGCIPSNAGASNWSIGAYEKD